MESDRGRDNPREIGVSRLIYFVGNQAVIMLMQMAKWHRPSRAGCLLPDITQSRCDERSDGRRTFHMTGWQSNWPLLIWVVRRSRRVVRLT